MPEAARRSPQPSPNCCPHPLCRHVSSMAAESCAFLRDLEVGGWFTGLGGRIRVRAYDIHERHSLNEIQVAKAQRSKL